MRILFIGDVVGSLGREALATYVPKLKKKYRPQVDVLNKNIHRAFLLSQVVFSVSVKDRIKAPIKNY